MNFNHSQLLPLRIFLMAFVATTLIAADFQSKSGCRYFLEVSGGDNYIAVGTRVRIQKATCGQVTDAYFLGRRGNKLHLLTTGKAPQKFYIDLASNNHGAQFEAVVESVEQDSPICSPLSTLNCLRFLQQQKGLPNTLNRRLEQEPENLLREMIDSFGLDTLQGRDEFKAAPAKAVDGRSYQHNLIRQFLADHGVRTESTSSVHKLMAHLGRKLPAVISVHATTRTEFEPSLEEQWNVARSIFDDSLSSGSFPVPRWAPSNHGPHSVAGLGVIPANHLIAGRRLLVLDTANNAINIWPALAVRSARPKFILLFPTFAAADCNMRVSNIQN
jgi:hypothetical protein